MDLDSELTVPQQEQILKLINSENIDDTLLGFSICNSTKRPSTMIDVVDHGYKVPFNIYIRFRANWYIMHINYDSIYSLWGKHIGLLESLSKY